MCGTVFWPGPATLSHCQLASPHRVVPAVLRYHRRVDINGHYLITPQNIRTHREQCVRYGIVCADDASNSYTLYYVYDASVYVCIVYVQVIYMELDGVMSHGIAYTYTENITYIPYLLS